MAPMIKICNAVMVAAMVITVTLLQCSESMVYRVGDNSGWKVPNGYSYNDWAAQHTFKAGDVIEFDFVTDEDTAAKVSFDDYENCYVFNPLTTGTSSPANYTLTPGQNYFISTMDNHCILGQKLAINVTEASAHSGFGSQFGSPAGDAPPNSNVRPSGSGAPVFGYRSAATVSATTAAGGLLLFSVGLALLF